MGTLVDHDRIIVSTAWDPRGDRLATLDESGKLTVWDSAALAPLWSAIPLSDDHVAVFSPAGELLHGDGPRVEKDLVYLVEIAPGELDLLTHSAFLKRVESVQGAGSDRSSKNRL